MSKELKKLTPRTESSFGVGVHSGKFMCQLLELENKMFREGIEAWLDDMKLYTDKQYSKGKLRALLTTDAPMVALRDIKLIN